MNTTKSNGRLPINREVGANDPYYRYFMPELKVSTISKATCLSNLNAVCAAIGTEPSYVARYLRERLGTTVALSKTSQWVVKGRASHAQLQSLVYDFIEAFVLCQKCGHPQLHIVWPSNEAKAGDLEQKRKKHKRAPESLKLKLDCEVCGASYALKPSKAVCGKVAQFMLENPPARPRKSLKSASLSSCAGMGPLATSSLSSLSNVMNLMARNEWEKELDDVECNQDQDSDDSESDEDIKECSSLNKEPSSVAASDPEAPEEGAGHDNGDALGGAGHDDGDAWAEEDNSQAEVEFSS